MAEKWADQSTLELLEAQIPSFEELYYRSQVEESAESLRKTLRSADQTKN